MREPARHAVLAVCVGQAEPVDAKGGLSGIFKRPVDGPVAVGILGLAGDTICDTANHGGPDQAVYVFGGADLDWWATTLQRELAAGTMGENLLLDGLETAHVNIGDRLVSDHVELQVTCPRIPCATLAARMGDRLFAKKFMAARRPGFYCRVLRPGDIQAGGSMQLERGDSRQPVLALFKGGT